MFRTATAFVTGLSISGLLAISTVHAQVPFFPLNKVQAGQKGTGKTVFQGGVVEEFQVEILGVLDNVGPKQSLILAKLSGGPLSETGVMQGMSGSPVYIEGKLVGAVALGFPFSKQPITGIRPIEEMIAATTADKAVDGRSLAGAKTPFDTRWMERLSRPAPINAGGSTMVEVATPLSFGGFTRGTLEQFTPQLEALGLSPRQGQSGGGAPLAGPMGNPAKLQPGGMISVQLMSGDMTVGADGTITHIDGSRIWAFGHRFLAAGPTELPFARAEVLALLPSLNNSFKISTAKEWMGVITEDRNTTIGGELGRRAARRVPLSITVGRQQYRMEIAGDRILAPMLLQMAIFSALDTRERALGPETVRVSGSIEFEGQKPVRVDNAYSGDFSTSLVAALGTSTPLAYALSTAPDLKLGRIDLRLDPAAAAPKVQIDQLWTSTKLARPGQDVQIFASLSTDGKPSQTVSGLFRVPDHMAPGSLTVNASDGASANLQDYLVTSTTLRSGAQVVSYLNDLRPASTVVLRVTRTEPSYPSPGGELPNPPPSVSLLLARAPGLTGTVRQSLVSELRIPTGQPVANSKSIQLEIRE